MLEGVVFFLRLNVFLVVAVVGVDDSAVVCIRCC